MIDLKLIFNTNYASLTRAIAGRGIGGIVGALVGGIVADKFAKKLDACTGLFCIIAATVLAAIPLAPNIDYLWCLYFAQGLANCVLNICGTRLVLEIWRESNTGVLQIIHTAYGIGALLTPLLCAPFLATTEISLDNSINVTNASRVHIPFFMVAVYSCSLSLPFFLWQSNHQFDFDSKDSNKPMDALKGPQPKRTFIEMINPATYTGGNQWFGWLMVFCLTSYYFNFMGCEKVFASFVRTFSVDALKFDARHASYLNTLFWISFTLGRLFTFFSSGVLNIRTLIALQAAAHLGSVTFLKYFASKSSTLFWAGTFAEGFTISPIYGLGVSLGSTQMEMSGMILTVVVLAGSIGDWTYLKASGRAYDTHGPSAILDVMEMAAWIMTGTIVIFMIAARKNKTLQ